MGDDTSEEFIMHKEAGGAPEDARKIHRITNYAVTYEDDDEHTIGRISPQQEELAKV